MKCLRLLSGFVLLAVVLPLQSRSLPQSPPDSTTLASQYFREAQVLCTRDRGKLWGISLCSPMLFVDRQTRAVIANQADAEGILTRNGNVFVGKLPPKVNIANTAIEWAGIKW